MTFNSNKASICSIMSATIPSRLTLHSFLSLDSHFNFFNLNFRSRDVIERASVCKQWVSSAIRTRRNGQWRDDQRMEKTIDQQFHFLVVDDSSHCVLNTTSLKNCTCANNILPPASGENAKRTMFFCLFFLSDDN